MDEVFERHLRRFNVNSCLKFPRIGQNFKAAQCTACPGLVMGYDIRRMVWSTEWPSPYPISKFRIV